MRWAEKTQAISKVLIDQMQLPSDFEQIVKSIYLPLTVHILNKKTDQPLFISINGAQGTGKSTLTYFLKHLINAESGLSVADISIDDFYLTRSERATLAQSLHPLLITRGVPGTHDVKLMENTLSKLMNGKTCSIPRFNKAIDDRYKQEQWTLCDKKIDIILFEGWCNHSPAQKEQDLLTPINKLETNEDPHCIWRRYANEQLKDYHKKIFSHADMSIMLKAPDFEKIYEWRSLQEEKLKKISKLNEQSHIMSADKIKRFIQHYERITRHTLINLPNSADIIIPVLADHSIKNFIKRNDK